MNWVEFANWVAAMALSGAIYSLWLGLLPAVLATVAVRAMPRSNATTRYAVWFTALLLVLAMPAVVLIPRPAPVMAAIAKPAALAAWAIPVTAAWPAYAALIWLAVTAILLARVAWSVAHINGLKRRARWFGRRDNIRLLASEEARVPMAAGFIRRAVIFPESVLEELSPAEFEQVLCHELAHLRRWDDWTQLVHAIAQAVLFFNPAVYWIGRRLKIEREIACDDWVVSTTGNARPYAACLTHLHELTRRASAPQLAPGATTKTRWQISTRIEALLEPDRNATPRFSRAGWMAAGILVSAALMVAARVTPPVGVQDLPLATMALAHPKAPAAPLLAGTVPKATPARPRLMASRRGRPALNQALRIAPDTGYVLVHAWHSDTSQTYFVITVVFFEPPPPIVMNGI